MKKPKIQGAVGPGLDLQAGSFKFHFERPCFSKEDTGFLETMVSEDLGAGCAGYVHLAEDARFKHLDFASFDRTLTAKDVVEYNSYVGRRHPGLPKTTMTQPTWLLSLETIDRLIQKAQSL